jgi:hypothetical protein
VFYIFAISTPANTAETAKVKTVLQLTRGHISQIQVHFPSGHIGLTHIQLTRGLHQFYPTNPEANFSSSGEAIVFAEDFDLAVDPFQLEAYTWNTDDTYDHTITVRVLIEPLEEKRSLLDEIGKLFGAGEAA